MAISHQDIKLKTVPGTVRYGSYSDDGHGNLVDDNGLHVGKIDYETGNITGLDIFDEVCITTKPIGEPSFRIYGWGNWSQESREIQAPPSDTRSVLFNTDKDNQDG